LKGRGVGNCGRCVRDALGLALEGERVSFAPLEGERVSYAPLAAA
jgi:hypothetical protein